jgi:hypothetical protein
MSSAAVAKTDSPARCEAALALLAATLFFGCVTSPLGYATPRTVEAGKATHTVAFESVPDAKTNDIPILPTYIVRVGMHERVDFGIRVLNGIDVKANAVRTRYFDASFNPRLQLLPFARNDRTNTYVSLPILLGLNPIPEISIVASGGPVFLFREKADAKKFIEGVIGLDLRPVKTFAIHPAIAFTRAFADDPQTFVIYGLGFTFGNVPVFD